MCTKNRFVLLIILCLFTACSQRIVYLGYDDAFLLTSPKKGWDYYHDEQILFSVNYKTTDITWESSKDGYIGSGNHLYAYLEPGLHKITAVVEGILSALTVQPGLSELIRTNLNAYEKVLSSHIFIG